MTAQVHEILIYDGERTSMAFCPPLPDDDPRVKKLDDEEIEEDIECRIMFSTDCWRGYVGTWEIRNGRFYLVGLRGRYRMNGDEPLLADWFTGVLRIPRGKVIQYVHMGFGSVFEEEVHVKVEQGVVTETRVIDNRGKEHDEGQLKWENMPGGENRFPGDDEM
ncbi:MAG: hypothetical protein RL885_21555 [Planctomycetota bacterium]